MLTRNILRLWKNIRCLPESETSIHDQVMTGSEVGKRGSQVKDTSDKILDLSQTLHGRLVNPLGAYWQEVFSTVQGCVDVASVVNT